MKNLILFLSLTINAFGAANDSIQTQRNSTDTGTVTRVVTIPTSGQDGIFTFDGASILPRIWTFSNGIVRNGTNLKIDFSGLTLANINLTVPYSALTGAPTLAIVATTGSYLDLINRPAFALVATSGDYNDLINKPSIPPSQVNSDWNAVSGAALILNKPTLATVASTGAYADLSGKPSLATVATTGAYADLSGKPTLGTAAATNSSAYATAAQGTTADSALQPTGNGSGLTGLTQSQISGLTAALAGKQATITTGTTAQYLRGDLSLATFPTNLSSFTNGPGYITGITSGNVTGALGYTPYDSANPSAFVSASGARSAISITTTGTSGAASYNSTTGVLNVPNYAPGTGTVTSIGISSTDFSVSGSPVTTSGSITLNLGNTGIAGTYSGVTTDGKGRVTSGTTRSFSNPARTLNSAFQISGSRDCLVSYTVDIACTISLTAGQTGTLTLEYADDSGFTTNVVTVQTAVNANTGALTIGLNLTQTTTAGITGVVPAGKYVRIRTANTIGTPSFTFRAAQEVLL